MRAWSLRKGRRTPSTIPNYIILTLLALFSAYPLLMLLFNSLKTNRQIGQNPMGPPALDAIRWSNFPLAWEAGRYAITMRNSAIIAGGAIVGVLVVAGLAAYSLARLRPRGSDLFTMYFLVGSAIPAALFLFPLFFLWKQLGLINTLPGIIIILVARHSTFATFLLRSYMVAIPSEIEDAARVDGASSLQVLRHIVFPLCRPGFLTVALIVGLWAWNEFLFAVTFIHDANLKPVATSLYAFQSQHYSDLGLLSAASVLMLIPSLGMFLLFQRRFIEGLTRGGMKG